MKVYKIENDFKIYLSDTGLLCALSGVHYADLDENSQNIFKGAVTENYFLCCLKSRNNPQYFYKPEQFMEIDYLMDTENGIYPVEIKSGRRRRSTSLKRYAEKFNPAKMYHFSRNNFGKAEKLYSIPLYAASWLENRHETA